MQHSNLFNKIISFFLLLGITTSLHAQIEEVVVTAQKRAEDVQDVPISISTFSGDFMQESGVDNLQQLSAYTPNLTLTQSSQVANNRIIMRGVGSVGNNAIEPSVAVFIDGVYYPRPSSVVGSLTDLEMVEVLRGPQGTLFGRNASMGALNIRTKKPSDEMEGQIRASYGNYDALRLQGTVSNRLSDSVAGRLSFHYMDRDGFGDNTFTGVAGNDDEFGDWEDMAIRGKLYFTPSENLDVTVTVDYSEVENENSIIEVIDDTVLPAYLGTLTAALTPAGTSPFAPSGPLPETTDGFDFEVNQDHRDNAEDDQWGIAGDINWYVGEHTIRSITAFRDWSNENFESALRLPADLFNRDTQYDAETFSQEIQIISPTGGKFEYVAGFYYYDEDYKIDQNFDLGADFCNAAGNLTQLIAAQTAIPTFAAAIAGLLPDPTQATAIASAIVTGTITTGAVLDAAFGLPAGTGAVLIATFAATSPTAPVLGAGSTATCAAQAQDDAVDTEFEQDLNSYALFGQLTFNVNDRLRLTGGIRWTKDEKEGSFTSIINNSIVAPASLTNPFGLDLRTPETAPDLDFDEEEVTWMANISYYMTDDIMLFATASTGFKSGGFNSEGFNSIGLASGASRTFDSETVDNYELGFKSTLLDNRMTANLTLFMTEISDFQDRQFDGVNFFVQNAGELTQSGVELDIQFAPIPQFFSMLGMSYLHSDFDEFPNATNLPAVVAATQSTNRSLLSMGMAPISVPPLDLEGARNHFSPKWQLSLLGEWTDAIPGYNYDWFLRGEFQYVSSQNIGAETNNNPQSVQDGYETVNARIGVRGQDKGWELSAFIRNAFDEEYCQTVFNQPIGTTLGLVDATTGGGMQRCVLGAPRTYGVEAAYRF